MAPDLELLAHVQDIVVVFVTDERHMELLHVDINRCVYPLLVIRTGNRFFIQYFLGNHEPHYAAFAEPAAHGKRSAHF